MLWKEFIYSPAIQSKLQEDKFYVCFTEIVRTDIPGYVTPGFVLQLRVPTHRSSLPTPAWQLFLQALGLEPWQISEQNSNFSALWFSQCSLMHLYPPDSEPFISLCAEMATLELGWSWSRRRKPGKMSCLLKRSMNLQCKLIVYTIKLNYCNSFIGSECFKTI